MNSFLGASPPRPAVLSLGWLPPRLLRVVRTAGHFFSALPLAAAPAFAGSLILAAPAPVFAQPQPVALYEANLHEGHTGDSFEVALTVRWSGAADAYDIPAPRPVPTAGLSFHMLGSESRHDGRSSRVRFRWRATALEPDDFPLHVLLPAIAYPADSPTPLTVRAEQPLTVAIARRRTPAATLGRLAAGLGGAVGLALAGAAVWRRRSARRDGDASREALAALAGRDKDRMADARRRRVEGEYARYLDVLLALAREHAAEAGALAELRALRERIAFASYQATDHELDRAEARVRRLLDDHQPPPSEEPA